MMVREGYTPADAVTRDRLDSNFMALELLWFKGPLCFLV